MFKKLLQKNWLVLLLIFAVIALIVTFIFNLLTPRKTVVPKTDFISTSPTGESTIFNNIRFTGTFIPPVSALPLATAQPSQTTLDYIRNQLIGEYGLQQVVGIPGLWKGELYTLSYDEYADEFLFYKNTVPQNSLLQEPSKAIQTAQTFVRATFPNLELIAQKENVVYFQGLNEPEETTSNKATILEIPFTYAINGIPVYLNHKRTAAITIIIDSFYEVQKVVFQPHFVNIIPAEQSVSLIDLGTALENIN
ncbi:MAG: hypothetical protein ABII10_01920, partial [Candidatus Paceibacterota bacterium]